MPLNLPQFTFFSRDKPHFAGGSPGGLGHRCLRSCAVLPGQEVEAPDTPHIHFAHIHIHLPMKPGARIAAIAVLNN